MSREPSNDRQLAFSRPTAPSPLQAVAKLRPPPKTRPPVHRPLVVEASYFWPERGQIGVCTLLAIFDLGLLLVLAWQLWGRR